MEGEKQITLEFLPVSCIMIQRLAAVTTAENRLLTVKK